jgi:hypothetical protein
MSINRRSVQDKDDEDKENGVKKKAKRTNVQKVFKIQLSACL